MATINLPININSATCSEDQYFYEDVVYRIDKKGNIEFGIVLENDDQDLTDENSGNENSPKRKKGEIRVVWHPSGVEELVNSKKVSSQVHLADRTLMPGDVVRRMIKGKDTQRGYCRDIKLNSCVQIMGTKQVLTNVNSEDLVPLEEFAADIAVCMDSWVGGIKMVHFKLWLITPDGSRCVMNEIDARGLEHFEEKRETNNDFPHSSEFYPGQSLWGPLHCLEEAQWIQCTKEMKAKRKSKPQRITKVIVEKVETDWVGVHWQCRAYSKDGVWSNQTQPKFVVEGDDLKKLKLLNVFEPSTLQVGDRNFYVMKGNENVTTKEQWKRQQQEIFQIPKFSPRKTRRTNVSQTEIEEKLTKKIDKSKENLKEENEKFEIFNEKRYVSVDNNLLEIPSQNLNVNSNDWNTEDTGSPSDSTSVSSGCSSLSSMGKKKKGPALVTKVLKKRKLCKARKKTPLIQLIPGTKIVVETLSTCTKADVIWQDGSVEYSIPSTQLYPIHHLDDKEFFPGDFVVDHQEEPRMYGVVQSVDHQGRTAKIKWFKTYTSSQCPQPTFFDEREVSVYDLKDHPDFQYRPGTLVIRIANFEGEDAYCTAGQVLDNYPEGLVKVWWIDSHVSMCWPQDLYKVGEYDSDEGDLWDDVSSDASWETELEDCFMDNQDCNSDQTSENIKPKLAAHIEKARIAMSRLEEIFTQNPALQTTEVMRRLLEVYKDCRYMDKLMGTAFFHESNFQGLLERVRERGRVNVAQRLANQVSRLFSQTEEDSNCVDSEQVESKDNSTLDDQEKYVTIEQSTSQLYINLNRNSDDSNLFTDKNKELRSSQSSSELPSEDEQNTDRSLVAENRTILSTSDDFEKIHTCSSPVCVKLCHLIKAQLVLAHAEVSKRFGLSKMSLLDATKTSLNDEKKLLKEKEKKIKIESSESCIEIPPFSYSEGEGFSIEESAPDYHKFKLTMFQPIDRINFFRAVSKELKLLKSSLPTGIWVKGFEDRMDLYSVMIRGPEKTPYENGLFLFDFQLSADYPAAPPLCHYISYCNDRLNPNLYEDGKVCVSLLGTWAGRGTELWTNSSTLLQVIVSIQGLILVAEPYFNEAGFEKQKGTQQGRENSRMYNEMVVLKLVQSQTKLILFPPSIFKDTIIQHFQKHAEKLLQRLELWMEISEQHNNQNPISPATLTTFKQMAAIDNQKLPEFPLIPASKGFCITLKNTLANFRKTLSTEKIIQSPSKCFEKNFTSRLTQVSSQSECEPSTANHPSHQLFQNISAITPEDPSINLNKAFQNETERDNLFDRNAS